MTYSIKDTQVSSEKPKVELGDMVQLQNGEPIEVVKCQETGVLMLNIDADQIQKGDLPYIKSLGLTISNPDTDKPVALGVDFVEDTWGQKISKWFESDDDDDDSHFFGGGSSSSSGGFLGGMGSGGFGGSFGGFGGGSFGGGGMSRGF